MLKKNRSYLKKLMKKEEIKKSEMLNEFKKIEKMRNKIFLDANIIISGFFAGNESKVIDQFNLIY